MENALRSQIEAEIGRFILEDNLSNESDEEIDCDENLFTSGLLDSMGAMRLISHLQSKYEYKIPPTDLVPGNFKTIRIMAGYLANQLVEK